MSTWKIGDVTVTKVVEMEWPIPAVGMLDGATDELLAPFAPHFVTDEGLLKLSFHALAVDTGSRRILVDTGIGNGRESFPWLPPLDTTFLADLAAAGYPPASIDTVVATHLHFDHIGGHTHRDGDAWVPTFTRARHLVVRSEWEHWTGRRRSRLANLDETLHPVADAGLLDLVEPDYELCPEVRLVPAPGHTPGQVCVRISSRGEEAVITGDLAHHPVQLVEPTIGVVSDVDPDLAVRTRQAFIREYAANGAIVIGTHFAGPTAGRLTNGGFTPA